MIKRLLKKMLNSSYGLKSTHLISRVKLSLFRAVSKSGRLSTFYYLLFSSVFDREHLAVMHGIIKYHGNTKTEVGNSFLLRRNIHRLEKGLIMVPRRDVFGLEYIAETLDSFEKAVLMGRSETERCGELYWAQDVLSAYFEVTTSHPVIDKAREKFNNIEKLNHQNQSLCHHIPYVRDMSQTPSVTYEQLLELARRRKSVRWYLNKPVPRELVDKAIQIATLSPSGCNRQPFVFRVFDEPEMVKKVSAIPGGTSGFNHNFPMIIVVVGKLGAFANERDRHLIYIDSSLASMALMLALETLGLSSCGINWPDLKTKEKQMASLLNLEPDERVVMLVSVGYPDPDGLVAFSQKKELDVIRKYN